MPFRQEWSSSETEEDEDFYTEDDEEIGDQEIFEVDTGEWERLNEEIDEEDGEGEGDEEDGEEW